MVSGKETTPPEGFESKNWVFRQLWPEREDGTCNLPPGARAAIGIIKSTSDPKHFLNLDPEATNIIALDGDGTLVWEASQGGHGLDETVKCSGKTDVEALDSSRKKLQAIKDSRKEAAPKS
ncbi:hypothetical protein J4E91_009502 [Alternaria rosae]|nr:hypothetical protein J4E91_009502 [Alternaria rosae]